MEFAPRTFSLRPEFGPRDSSARPKRRFRTRCSARAEVAEDANHAAFVRFFFPSRSAGVNRFRSSADFSKLPV
jgi:hypothetical protein